MKLMRRCMRLLLPLAILKEFEEKCGTPDSKLKQAADAITAEIHAGLAYEGGSKLKMLISYVGNLPTGDENGVFYALDLGGTNFGVLLVQLGGKDGGIVHQEFAEASIPPNLMVGTSEVTETGIEVLIACLPTSPKVDQINKHKTKAVEILKIWLIGARLLHIL